MMVRAWVRPGSISCVQAATYQALRIHMRSYRTGFPQEYTLQEAPHALEVAAVGLRHARQQGAFVGAVDVLGRDAKPADRVDAMGGEQVADVGRAADGQRDVPCERLVAGRLEGAHERVGVRHDVGWP